MKVVIFGLTISSAWANGHATLWRGLCRALHASGHDVVFFERDVPYYAQHRDMSGTEWCGLVLYRQWSEIAEAARHELSDADVGIVTSYCPDGPLASRVVLDSSIPRKVYYDLDSPVTLAALARGERVAYLPDEGLGAFDLVLSYAGGAALEGLKQHLGARLVAPLYGSADPDVHRPVAASPLYRNDLSYLGTYAADRQEALDELFVLPARLQPRRTFALAGSQYPRDFPWTSNMLYFRHLAPPEHAPLFCSSSWTLSVTRGAMASVGYCPSGRLFEATACGAPVITDSWEGLGDFFEAGSEIAIARRSADVLEALEMSDRERRQIAAAGRARTLECHSSAARARELERLLEPSWHGCAEVG
jgi:spore maturation protein CgeB